MVRGAVLLQPLVALLKLHVSRPWLVVYGTVRQHVSEHEIQPCIAVRRTRACDDVLPYRVMARASQCRSLPATGSQCQDVVHDCVTQSPSRKRKAPTMSLVDKIKDAAGPVITMATPVVAQAIEKATPLVERAMEKAAPYVEQAREKADPFVHVARELAGPMVEQAINKAGPYAEKVSVTAGPILDQAKEKAGPLVEKVSGMAVDLVGAAVFTADKATGGRYHDQLETVTNVLSRNGKAGGSH